MKSVFLGLILGLLAALSAAPSAGQGAGRPNIVFILFDDLGYGSLGVYGSELVETPNVDAVARQGMRFTQYYANAPVCSPTRAGLLTGLHPSHLGIRQAVRLPDDKGVPRGVVTVPALLKGRGYATGHVGKWHLGRLRPEFSPESHGFDEAIVFHPPSYADPLFSSEGRFFRVKGHATELMVDYALDFLRRRAPSAPGDPPFFLNLWLFAPHLPLNELPPRGAPYPDDLTEHQVAFTLFHSVRAEGTWVRLYVDPDELRPVEINVSSGEVNPSERPVLIGAGADFGSRFLGSIFDPRFYNASLCEPTVVEGELPRPE